jgi:hypothetical protein
MKRTVFAMLVGAVVLSGGVAQAVPISIVNFGFEAPDIGTTSSVITGWTQTGGGSGVWDINAFPAGFWSVPAPQGSQVAFLSNAPSPGTAATISQVLAANQLANTTYTLTGSVGEPIGFSAGTIYTVALFGGGNLLQQITGTGPAGSFSTFTLTYNSLVADGPLEIRLSSNQAQVAFDNIQLDASSTLASVPEPASLLLLGTGLCLLARQAGRRGRK